jgi:hypothetical protein
MAVAPLEHGLNNTAPQNELCMSEKNRSQRQKELIFSFAAHFYNIRSGLPYYYRFLPFWQSSFGKI